MSSVPTYFSDFISNIRLPDELRTELQNAHKELRERLNSDPITSDLMVDSFLQGRKQFSHLLLRFRKLFPYRIH